MFAYVPSAADNDVGAFTINGTNGALTTILGSPFTAGTQPSGVLTVP
jgi:6-phosphogluconolactonase